MGLEKYREKRDFDATAEPAGDAKPDGEQRFVIQKHDASSMHYDFRLEVDGVLKSWAVPKGPSTDPGEKRLAVPTEDHPIDYINFEGVIPDDEYGAGAVLVWDRGTYRNLKNGEEGDDEVSVADQVDHGKVSVWLEGDKISGGYTLVQMSGRDDWLLIKMDDEEADARRNPTSTEDRSVVSDRDIDEIYEEEGDGGEEADG